MRWQAPLAGMLVAAAIFCAGCSSRAGGPYPTLEDYSDGTSRFAEALLDGWKSGSPPDSLFETGLAWSGPLPGEGLTREPARPPMELAVYRQPEKAAPGGGGNARPSSASAELVRALVSMRSRFSRLGRCEATLFDMRRRGDGREILLHVLLSGTGVGGELRQEGGKLRLLLSPVSVSASQKHPGWRIRSGSVVSWLSASAGAPLYDDVSERAGLTRPHVAFLPNAAKNVPIPGEHMPPGAAVLDFDGDGRQDVFVVGGDGNRLYRNNGDGAFADVAERAGVAGQEGEAIGAVAFDYDNDGRTDLYVTYLFRPNRLYRNRGDGTFEETAEKAGVALNEYCTSAAALDYDRDGLPDLYVLVYGHPENGPTLDADNAPPNHLYRNNGDGTFTDVSTKTHADDTGWGLAVQSADLDGDGWPDIYVANDFGKNTYLHNRGDGTFENAAKRAGVLDPGFGMGVAVDDVDGDGRPDFYVSNYSFPLKWLVADARYPMPAFPYSLGRPFVWRRLQALSRGSSLFRGLGGDRFERISDEADVWDTSWSWGCVFVDADLDGRPDIFVVNGMVTGKNETDHEIDFWNLMSAEFKKFEKGTPVGEWGDDSLWGRLPKRLYRNRDGRHFDEIAAISGLESTANQRGLVVLDANGDGVPDLFAAGFLQPPQLWIHRNPSHAKTLVVSLRGDPAGRGAHRSTRDALGAAVTVTANGISRTQFVSAGYSFLSSGPRELYFGLGDAEAADRIVVRWPSGRVTEKQAVPAGRLELEESP